MPKILSLMAIDYADWHAGRITIRTPHLLDAPEDEGIEESELHFEVVQLVTGHGDKNEVVMDDCEQYYLARVAD